MLKRQNRLKIIAKRKNDKNFSSQLFRIRVSDKEGADNRFGFVVSKKISKSSVVRNRTKRVLRDSVASILNDMVSGKNVVIIAKNQLSFGKEKETKESLKELFKKADILKKQ